MLKILNIIKGLNSAGASRSMMAVSEALSSSGYYDITIASFLGSEINHEESEKFGIKFLLHPTKKQLFEAITQADIVQLEWWNDPVIYKFLRRRDLPGCRLIAFSHVAGDRWPNVVLQELINVVDVYIGGCKYAAQIPLLRQLPKEVYRKKIKWAYATTDFNRLNGITTERHDTFNIGYVGSIDYKKMHPGFVRMSGAANIPNVQFYVIGNGHINLLKQEAYSLGYPDKFKFPGYVEDIKKYYGKMDVFGYPLCDSPGAELVIQDALYAGIPAVVFGLGGLNDAILHNYNGLVINSTEEYTQALEYLYNYPEERHRMSRNASEYAKKTYGVQNTVERLIVIYEATMKKPKRERVWTTNSTPSLRYGFNTGSAQLIESLSSEGGRLFSNFFRADNSLLPGCIKRIRNMTPREKTIVERYSTFYQKDPYLQLWQGIVLQSENRIQEANQYYDKAYSLGIPIRLLDQLNISNYILEQ